MNKSKIFNGQPIIKQVLNYIDLSLVDDCALKHQSDRYTKKFKTYEHLVTMVVAVLSNITSLRDITNIFHALEGKLTHLNLKYFPKRSTISDANSKRTSEVFGSIYYGLLKKYFKVISDSSETKPAVKGLKIVDSSTISLFGDVLKGVGRNKLEGKKKGGIKVHTMIDALADVPTLIKFSSASTHDHTFLKDLNLEEGSIVVFDKGYNDYEQYAKWSYDGISYITRQKRNAKYTKLEDFDLGKEIPNEILIDELIEVYKAEQRILIRRIAYWDEGKSKVYEFITNNMYLEPDKIADIYKNRWQIELLFKRLKQNFPLKYFLGDSQNAIEIQIWVSLIIQLIMLVIKAKLKKNWSFSNMVSVIRFHLASYLDLVKFLNDPFRKWEEIASKPPDQYELNFEMTG